MSNKQIDRIRELERQFAALTEQVRALQARPAIVINNPAPQVVMQPHVPYQPLVTWNPSVHPSTTCDAGSVGFTGQLPTVSVSH